MTAKLNLVVRTNADLRMVVSVVGGPESLVGYTGRMQIRRTAGADTTLADYDSDEITVDASAREVSLVVPAEQTSGYAWDRGVYDLVISGDDGVYPLVEGTVAVSVGVTR